MTPRAFVQQGESERLKGAFHATTAGLMAVMAVYNIAALCFRKERHLATNAVMYTLATVFEARKTLHHWS